MAGTKAPVDAVTNLQNNPSAIQKINENDDTLSDAIQRSLSRQVELDSEGDPIDNAMETDLDMNENRIQNLPLPVSAHEPARKGEVDEVIETAEGFADDAEASATAAASSASSAAGSASSASSSASAASASASAAAASASAASTSASNASTSASTATTQASNASSSAAAALTSENNAETAETNAAASASDADASAGIAADAAADAGTAQVAAEAAQALAEAAADSIDSFRDIYCGTSASDPSVDLNGSAVAAGDFYFNTGSETFKVYNGATWDDFPSNTLAALTDVDFNDLTDGDKLSFDGSKWVNVAVSAGEGDVSSDETSVSDGQLPVFSGTDGKHIKKSTLSGILKAASGVVSAAASGTDYAPATSGSAILKGNGSGGFSNAASGTDYAPATSGSAILKGNGSGGFSNAASGTDYAPATSGSSLLKGNGSGGFSNASAGTDYMAPASPATISSKSDDYAFATGDENKIFEQTGSNKTFTVPKDATNNLTVGCTITIVHLGTNACTIAPEDGTITIRSRNGLILGGIYAVATLYKSAANLWVAGGDLKAS